MLAPLNLSIKVKIRAACEQIVLWKAGNVCRNTCCMLSLCHVIRRWLSVDQDSTLKRPNSKNASVGKKLVENKREREEMGSRKKTRLGEGRKEEINIYIYDFVLLTASHMIMSVYCLFPCTANQNVLPADNYLSLHYLQENLSLVLHQYTT